MNRAPYQSGRRPNGLLACEGRGQFNQQIHAGLLSECTSIINNHNIQTIIELRRKMWNWSFLGDVKCPENGLFGEGASRKSHFQVECAFCGRNGFVKLVFLSLRQRINFFPIIINELYALRFNVELLQADENN